MFTPNKLFLGSIGKEPSINVKSTARVLQKQIQYYNLYFVYFFGLISNNESFCALTETESIVKK